MQIDSLCIFCPNTSSSSASSSRRIAIMMRRCVVFSVRGYSRHRRNSSINRSRVTNFLCECRHLFADTNFESITTRGVARNGRKQNNISNSSTSSNLIRSHSNLFISISIIYSTIFYNPSMASFNSLDDDCWCPTTFIRHSNGLARDYNNNS